MMSRIAIWAVVLLAISTLANWTSGASAQDTKLAAVSPQVPAPKTSADGTDAALDGNNLYAVTFAKGELPPVNAFWSLTLYNEGHLFHPNDLNRFSLGTKNKTLKFNDDGSLTLFAGAKSPGKDKESNWLPAPKGPFSLYIRAYWPKEVTLDGTWKPPAIKRMP